MANASVWDLAIETESEETVGLQDVRALLLALPVFHFCFCHSAVEPFSIPNWFD